MIMHIYCIPTNIYTHGVRMKMTRICITGDTENNCLLSATKLNTLFFCFLFRYNLIPTNLEEEKRWDLGTNG